MGYKSADKVYEFHNGIFTEIIEPLHNDSHKNKLVTCLWCGKEFSTKKNSNQKFCCHACNGFYYNCLKYNVEYVKPEKTTITWTSNLAYFVGLIASDGTLRKYRNTIRIASKDIDLLEDIRTIVCEEITGRKNRIVTENIKLGEKIFVNYSYQFSSGLFYNFCLNIGIMPNKSLILGEIKIPGQYFKDFLRGIIDGDGNYNPQDKRVYVRIFSGSYDFLYWLNDQCKQYLEVYRGIIVKDKDRSKYTLFWSTKAETNKIINIIYKDAEFYLDRKRESVKELIV